MCVCVCVCVVMCVVVEFRACAFESSSCVRNGDQMTTKCTCSLVSLLHFALFSLCACVDDGGQGKGKGRLAWKCRCVVVCDVVCDVVCVMCGCVRVCKV